MQIEYGKEAVAERFYTSRNSLLYFLYYTPLLPRELTLIGGVPVPLKNDCP